MKTQIFGTFGPACATEEILNQMIDAGMTGMRLNLSHAALIESEAYIRAYQRAAVSRGVEPQILIDMQGPELRVGKMEKSVELGEQKRVIIGHNGIPVSKEVLEAVEIGDEILFDDGKISMRVLEITDAKDSVLQEIIAEVIRGGILHSHKSVKVVGKHISLPPLTKHDVENIKVAKKYGVIALMQPFVLSGEDLHFVRESLKEYGAEDVQIYAKIENRLGMENLTSILSEADVIVIARGDLGNDMPLWELPMAQKKIEKACKDTGKPYIVVTQMLASMEKNPVPTRAEVSDIFHAVYHGAWGVMLTGETAVGKYPVEAIAYLNQTAKSATDFS